MVYGAPQQFVTYAAQPTQQVVYMNAPEGQPVLDEQGQVIQAEGMVMEQQPVTYLQGAEAQQVVYVDEQGNPIEAPAEGQVFVEPGQMMYAAPPPVAAPARINVSPEIFAKLAAGGVLTPEEMAQLSGQAAPEQPVHAEAAVAGAAPGVGAAAAVTSAKASKKKSSSSKGSKKALKASKKKKSKGCC